MAPTLQAILEAELARGNAIVSVGDWPPTCRLFVMLARPFAKRYRTPPGIAYTEPKDPHYWRAEYALEGGAECLAGGF